MNIKLSEFERLVLIVALVLAAVIITVEIRRAHARELAQREAMFEDRIASSMADHAAQLEAATRTEVAVTKSVEQVSDRAFNAWTGVGLLAVAIASDWAQTLFFNN